MRLPEGGPAKHIIGRVCILCDSRIEASYIPVRSGKANDESNKSFAELSINSDYCTRIHKDQGSHQIF